MVGSSAGDPPPDLVGLVNATSGDLPRSPFHVRDDEAAIADLAPCVLGQLSRDRCTRVALSMYPLALWVPDLANAISMDVPGEQWYGWQWSTSEFLLVHVSREPALSPSTVANTGPQYCRLQIAERPMRVRRVAPGDSGSAAYAYAAEVQGHLDDATELWGQAVAPDMRRREELLAALATLERLT